MLLNKTTTKNEAMSQFVRFSKFVKKIEHHTFSNRSLWKKRRQHWNTNTICCQFSIEQSCISAKETQLCVQYKRNINCISVSSFQGIIMTSRYSSVLSSTNLSDFSTQVLGGHCLQLVTC